MTIRPRRQVTLPPELLKTWDLTEGDGLVLEVAGNEAKVKPKKQSFDALMDEIHMAFRESGIPESEFLDAVEKEREERAKKLSWA